MSWGPNSGGGGAEDACSAPPPLSPGMRFKEGGGEDGMPPLEVACLPFCTRQTFPPTAFRPPGSALQSLFKPSEPSSSASLLEHPCNPHYPNRPIVESTRRCCFHQFLPHGFLTMRKFSVLLAAHLALKPPRLSCGVHYRRFAFVYFLVRSHAPPPFLREEKSMFKQQQVDCGICPFPFLVVSKAQVIPMIRGWGWYSRDTDVLPLFAPPFSS